MLDSVFRAEALECEHVFKIPVFLPEQENKKKIHPSTCVKVNGCMLCQPELNQTVFTVGKVGPYRAGDTLNFLRVSQVWDTAHPSPVQHLQLQEGHFKSRHVQEGKGE